LPEPWVDVDVATVTTVGSASFSSARAFTVNGSGGDIGSVGDSFNFVYLNLTNSGTIIARLASTAFVGTIGKIGLTMRETTNGNSIQAFTFLDRQNNTLRMTFRSSTGGNTSSVGSGPASIIPPEWLKLQRAGNTFTSSYSSDGSTWTPFATNTFGSFASPYCLGLAVCSRNAALATGVFDNVSVPGFASPTTPTNLTATAASSSEIDLNWSASSTANGYNIYRSTTNGGTYSAIATGVSSTSFNNTDLSSGTNYYYVVTAVNTAGESTNSLQVGATTIPAAPASLSATGGSAQVELVWLASFGATSYNVYRSDTSGGPYAQIADSLATTNYTDTGVVGGTTNYYVVTAENSSGEGVNSTEASAMTIPSAPTGLTAIAGDGQVALNWIASMGASGYNVKRSTTDRGVYSTIANVTSVAYTNTGLSNCTLYYFVVSATNAIGESLNSSQVSVRSVSMTSLPINLTVNNARIQFFWPTDHTGWRLQAQTNSLNNGLGTNWVMLVGSNSTNQMTVPINRGGGSVFYRLVYP
jgi:fibronectin type 3 domain-containing protein